MFVTRKCMWQTLYRFDQSDFLSQSKLSVRYFFSVIHNLDTWAPQRNPMLLTGTQGRDDGRFMKRMQRVKRQGRELPMRKNKPAWERSQSEAWWRKTKNWGKDSQHLPSRLQKHRNFEYLRHSCRPAKNWKCRGLDSNFWQNHIIPAPWREV